MDIDCIDDIHLEHSIHLECMDTDACNIMDEEHKYSQKILDVQPFQINVRSILHLNLTLCQPIPRQL